MIPRSAKGDAQKAYDKGGTPLGTLSERIQHVVESAFNGRRVVIFSGGEAKGEDALYNEIRGLRDGGGFGSIIGRNAFQRDRASALELLKNVIQIYLGKI
jgi:class I fructose-bisphosphate aldolase